MKFLKFSKLFSIALLASAFAFTSCDKDDDDMDTPKASATYTYDFSGMYKGSHETDFRADLKITEIDANSATVEVTLYNTVNGQTYMIHAHDAADPATTPNNTPYDETPNGDVLVRMATGNGGTVTVSQTANKSFAELTTSYDAFFVVHDPLQPISTTDLTTYLTVGAFGRTQPDLKAMTFTYNFSGQYSGNHSSDFRADLRIIERDASSSMVQVTLYNTVAGETYRIHSHDAADPATTPNGTPYIETPNGDVLVQMATGNGGTITVGQMANLSYDEIVNNYDAFFVVHDPLQPISTVDLTTYLTVGAFARVQ